MKFLLFNAVVVAALIFLFNGGDWSFQGPGDPTPSNATQPAPAKTVTPEPPQPKAAPVIAVVSNPTPLPPAVAERRAAVLAGQEVEAAVDSPAKTGFASKRERRQSLLSMAEEMELFSLDANAR